EPFVAPGCSRIRPSVGRLRAAPGRLRPAPGESARVFTLPLGALAAPGVYRVANRPDGRPLEAFVCQGEVIWGATARILRRVLELATGEAPRPEGPFPWGQIRI